MKKITYLKEEIIMRNINEHGKAFDTKRGGDLTDDIVARYFVRYDKEWDKTINEAIVDMKTFHTICDGWNRVLWEVSHNSIISEAYYNACLGWNENGNCIDDYLSMIPSTAFVYEKLIELIKKYLKRGFKFDEDFLKVLKIK